MNSVTKIKLRNAKSFMILHFSVLLVVFVPAVVFAQGLVPCDGTATNPCGFDQFITLIQNIINFLTFNVAVPLVAIAFAWAGIIMLSAGGDTGKITQAKEIFGSVLIGFLITLSAWLIVSTLLGVLLGGNVASFVRSNFMNF